MKLDTQTLVKHKFWVALGAFGLIWFIAVIIGEVMGGTPSKKDYDAAKTAVDGALAKGPKNQSFVTPWERHGKMFRDHKEVIWAKAWGLQKDMYTWPHSPSAQLQDILLYPDDPFGPTDDADLNARTDYMNTLYKEQWEGLSDLIRPAECLGGIYSIVPQQEWTNSENKPPSREEIWLAQEDFWVRRELLLDVASAIAAAGHFKVLSEEVFDTAEKAKQAKVPESVYKRVRFRNINWEVELLVQRDRKRWAIHPDSQIKNVHPNRRTLAVANPHTNRPLEFRISDPKGQASYFLAVSGEPLAWKASRPLVAKAVPVDTFPYFDRPFELDQIFEWDYSPVRRVDTILLGKHSHRTLPGGLQARADLKALDAPAGAPAAQTQPSTPVAGGGMGMASSRAGGGFSRRPSIAAAGGGRGRARGGAMETITEDPTPINHINRNRYLYVTEQCRHLPLAIQVVCEQIHVNDVLTALSNSRLRIQVTQVHFRDSEPIQREPPEKKQGSPAGGMGGMAGMGGFAGLGGMGRPGRPGGGIGVRRRAPGPEGERRTSSGSGNRAGPLDVSESNIESVTASRPQENLVELTVYAIATLYERYPPKPKTAKPASGSQPAAATTPAKP